MTATEVKPEGRVAFVRDAQEIALTALTVRYLLVGMVARKHGYKVRTDVMFGATKGPMTMVEAWLVALPNATLKTLFKLDYVPEGIVTSLPRVEA